MHRFPIISGIHGHGLELHRDLSANASHRPTGMSENVPSSVFDRDEENRRPTITALSQADFHTFSTDWFEPSSFVEPFTGGSTLPDLTDGTISYFALQNTISGIDHASGYDEHWGIQPSTEYINELSNLLNSNQPGNPELSGSIYPTPRQVQEECRTEESNNELSQIVSSQVSHLLT